MPLLLVACSDEQQPPPYPTEFAIVPHAELNKVALTKDGHIMWNGRQVTVEQLRSVLQATRKLDPEPELRFLPDQDADYDEAGKVLNIIRESGVTKFGFVGNEAYSASDASSN